MQVGCFKPQWSGHNVDALCRASSRSANINTPLLGSQQTLFRFIEILRA
jgi:hypothetical protein